MCIYIIGTCEDSPGDFASSDLSVLSGTRKLPRLVARYRHHF